MYIELQQRYWLFIQGRVGKVPDQATQSWHQEAFLIQERGEGVCDPFLRGQVLS